MHTVFGKINAVHSLTLAGKEPAAKRFCKRVLIQYKQGHASNHSLSDQYKHSNKKQQKKININKCLIVEVNPFKVDSESIKAFSRCAIDCKMQKVMLEVMQCCAGLACLFMSVYFRFTFYSLCLPSHIISCAQHIMVYLTSFPTLGSFQHNYSYYLLDYLLDYQQKNASNPTVILLRTSYYIYYNAINHWTIKCHRKLNILH